MIDTQKIVNMINHWLATPVNGYFSQSYGSNVKEQLLKNLSAFSADNFLKKLKTDIPILSQLDSEQLGIVTQMPDFENVYVYIQLGKVFIEVGVTNSNKDTNQDYYNVAAS